MSVQMYGSFKGYDSFSTVSRQIAWALRRRHIHGSVYAIKTANPVYTDVPWNVNLYSRAPVGIYVGYPAESSGWLAGHKHRILVTVCETDRLPPEWVHEANMATLVVVPSEWCAGVYRTAGVKVPVMVVPHGVSHVLTDSLTAPTPTPTAPIQSAASPRLLHVSGALSFPARKGTSQLLLAFAELIEEGYRASLELKLPAAPIGVLKAVGDLNRRLKIPRIGLVQHKELHPALMPDFYRQYDAVIQPSRGEGFGMVPLEARAVGVPAVLTKATGHLQHFQAGVDIPIEVGNIRPLETQGNNFGGAPSVKISAVKNALRTLLDDLPMWKRKARNWATTQGEKWTWETVLRPFSSTVKTLSLDESPKKPGEEAGLRGI